MHRRDGKIIQNAIWKTGRDGTRRYTLRILKSNNNIKKEMTEIEFVG
jgi:hypothetical protein